MAHASSTGATGVTFIRALYRLGSADETEFSKSISRARSGQSAADTPNAAATSLMASVSCPSVLSPDGNLRVAALVVRAVFSALSSQWPGW